MNLHKSTIFLTKVTGNYSAGKRIARIDMILQNELTYRHRAEGRGKRGNNRVGAI